MDGERVVVECGRVGVEREVARLQVDHRLSVASENAVHRVARVEWQRKRVDTRLDIERLRVAVRARESELAVRGREDDGPHLVLELEKHAVSSHLHYRIDRSEAGLTSWKFVGAPTGSLGVAFFGCGRAHMMSWSLSTAGA